MKPKHGVQRIEPDHFDIGPSETSPPQTDELSLEELSAAYSKLMGEPETPASSSGEQGDESSDDESNDSESKGNPLPSQIDGDACPVTGRSILEAALFVGHPENVGLKPDYVASMMRGVQASEIVEWIAELNQHYIEHGHVMRIVEEESGFRMQLAPEHQALRDSMTGKLRETQLNQAAIDCLSLVAYQPGITQEELERLWSRPAGSVLGLLVRRELLRIERTGKGKQAVTQYFPTDRFLNLVGIASLDDLPMAESEFE
jgi:segregation and condensation protein B